MAVQAREVLYERGGEFAHSERPSLQHSVRSEWPPQRRGLLRARRLEMDRQGISASASVSLARCCADLIVTYWERLQAAGQLEGRTLSVLQWGAGTGRLTYRMLRELRERLAISTVAGRELRYAACDDDVTSVVSMHGHPYLRDDISAGRLIVRHIEGSSVEEWQEAVQDHLDCPAVPLVVVATDVFVEAEQELLGFLDGGIFTAVVDRETVAACSDASTASGQAEPEPGEAGPIEWSELDRLDSLPCDRRSLLLRYAGRLDNVPVLLPTGALDFADACTLLTRGRYLLLAADFGIHSEQQLRAGVYAELSAGMPVNFHALTRYQREQGAQAWSSMTDRRGRVLHIALHRAAHPPAVRDDLFDALTLKATRYIAGDLDVGCLVGPLDPESACEQGLTAVSLANDDPRMLSGVVDSVLAGLDNLTVECCQRWQATVERVWHNYFPVGGDDTAWFDIGTLALHVGHWGVAKSAFTVGLATYPSDPGLLHRLSYCEASTGHGATALRHIQQAAADSGESHHREFEAVLLARLNRWNALPWYCPDRSSDGDLTLEPLGSEHVDSLLIQYRDPQIGAMTRLPELTTRDDALAWLEEQNLQSGRAHYAVMHACWGFVGVVSLQRHEDSAYFYFWIGADYQGAGFGRRAARLLFQQAAVTGVSHLFTSAYASNQRSRTALKYLDFDQLDVAAAAPDDDLVFFHRPDGESDLMGASRITRLRELFHAIESPISRSILIHGGRIDG